MKKRRRVFLACIMSVMMALVMAVPMSVSGAVEEKDVAQVGTEGYETLQEAIAAANEEDEIVLLKDVTVDQIVSFDNNKAVYTLNLNGNNLTAPGLVAKNSVTLTIKDGTATAEPEVSEDFEVTYTSGKVVVDKKVAAESGAEVVLVSGMIDSKYLGLASSANSTVTIKGGYILSQEFAVTAQGQGAIANFDGGVAEAKDNAVFAGNGTPNLGGTIMNVSGGIMIGHIISEGYTSCGIYHPQKGVLTITGGTIYSENGCGILMRGGDLKMTGGTVIASGDESIVGKVGDSRIVVGPSGIVFDKDAGYYGAEDVEVVVSGEAIVAGAKSAVEVIDSNSANAAKQVETIGGAYSSDITAFVPEDKVSISFYADEEDAMVYFVGGDEEINAIIAEADAGDEIVVLKGSVKLDVDTSGVKIKNGKNNTGVVIVNGTELKPNYGITTPEKQEPTDPSTPITPTNPGTTTPTTPADKPDSSADTGDDFNMSFMLAVMGIAGAAIIATMVVGRKKKVK